MARIVFWDPTKKYDPDCSACDTYGDRNRVFYASHGLFFIPYDKFDIDFELTIYTEGSAKDIVLSNCRLCPFTNGEFKNKRSDININVYVYKHSNGFVIKVVKPFSSDIVYNIVKCEPVFVKYSD